MTGPGLRGLRLRSLAGCYSLPGTQQRVCVGLALVGCSRAPESKRSVLTGAEDMALPPEMRLLSRTTQRTRWRSIQLPLAAGNQALREPFPDRLSLFTIFSTARVSF
eukprot:1811811-Rhodomonas_salina.1